MMENSKNCDSLKSQEFEPYDDFQNIYKSKMLDIVDENHVKYEKGYSNITDSEPLVVSKYMKLSHLLNSIKEDYFFFGSPESWNDPFEMLFYKPKIKILDEEVTLHACCFACNDIDNEEGFWIIWSKGENEPIVRVTYNVKRLMEMLNKDYGQYEFYLSGMAYKSRELSKAAISQTYNNIKEYLNDLSLKRNAYKYENELRLYVKRKDSNESCTILKDFNYKGNIITEITLPPMEPLGNSHPAKDMVKCIQDCMNLEVKKRIASIIKKKKMNCIITQSALYCTGIRERTY